MYYFNGYNPYTNNTRKTEEEPQATEAQKSIARLDALATRISKDGKRAYRLRMGNIEYCDWNEETHAFGSWWIFNETDFPQDTVVL